MTTRVNLLHCAIVGAGGTVQDLRCQLNGVRAYSAASVPPGRDTAGSRSSGRRIGAVGRGNPVGRALIGRDASTQPASHLGGGAVFGGRPAFSFTRGIAHGA